MRGGVMAVGRRNELPELTLNACSALVLKALVLKMYRSASSRSSPADRHHQGSDDGHECSPPDVRGFYN
jgi:hypothetical protein